MPRVQFYTKCKKCGGSGIAVLTSDVVENPCGECLGSKYVEAAEQIDLSSADDGVQTDLAAVKLELLSKIDTLQASTDAVAERIGLMDGKLDNIWKKVEPLSKCKHME